MAMRLASTLLVEREVSIRCGYTNQRPSGSIRLPGASDIVIRKDYIRELDRSSGHNRRIGICIQRFVVFDPI